jgi:hypothetical protein
MVNKFRTEILYRSHNQSIYYSNYSQDHNTSGSQSRGYSITSCSQFDRCQENWGRFSKGIHDNQHSNYHILVASLHITCLRSCNFMKLASTMKGILHSYGIHATTIQPELVDENYTKVTITLNGNI